MYDGNEPATGRGMLNLRAFAVVAAVAASGCVGEGDVGTTSSDGTENGLTGCKGQASKDVPDDGTFVLTTFGTSDDKDTGTMSCGTQTMGGSWFYAASRQR